MHENKHSHKITYTINNALPWVRFSLFTLLCLFPIFTFFLHSHYFILIIRFSVSSFSFFLLILTCISYFFRFFFLFLLPLCLLIKWLIYVMYSLLIHVTRSKCIILIDDTIQGIALLHFAKAEKMPEVAWESRQLQNDIPILWFPDFRLRHHGFKNTWIHSLA